MPGIHTSQAEVSHVSQHGFWLLLADEELFLPFTIFPWFHDATIEQLCFVEWPTKNHLYWPSLDIDLSVESIRNPSAFPLMAVVPAPDTAVKRRENNRADPNAC
jgi:hypothetical protein